MGDVPARPRCAGLLLAGGLSRRMGGSPKGLRLLAGRPMLERPAAALAASCDRPLLVSANAPGAERWLAGARVVRDRATDAGPLAGVAAALAEAGTALLALAWDMPFVPAALLADLRALGEREGRAAVAEHPGAPGDMAPLCAWWPVGALPELERRLAVGERSVLEALAGAARLPAGLVRRYGDPDVLFLSVNTPADLARAERLAATEPWPAHFR